MEEDEVRPEDDLPVIMCSNMLIPRLNDMIAQGAFDAYSKPHVSRAVDLAEQMEASLGRENLRYSVSDIVYWYLILLTLSSRCLPPSQKHIHALIQS